jgi:Rps23 Pro-64 3,4-dihydroxylase Tpa1-like proline 4-hydroxylase
MEQLNYHIASEANVIQTKLPKDIADTVVQAIENDSSITGRELHKGGTINNADHMRNSAISFTPNHHWITGFMWYYVSQCNMYNFMYDIEAFDNSVLQYTVYTKGMFYDWHSDDTISNQASMVQPRLKGHQALIKEYTRKLSFSLQLSGPDEYEGGELQIMVQNKLHTVPKDLGSIVIFDSRLKHRVRKVKSGVRRSLVGWVLGPRWK